MSDSVPKIDVPVMHHYGLKGEKKKMFEHIF